MTNSEPEANIRPPADQRLPRGGRWPMVAQVVVIIGGAIAVNFGVALGVLVAASSLPWVLEGIRRRSGTVTMALLILTWLVGLMVLTMVTGAFDAPMLAWFTVAAAAFGVVGVIISRGRLPQTVSREGALTWGGATLGGAMWLFVVGVAATIPGGARYAWVMLGDSANNVLFGREVIYRNGLATGPEENPVPLPSAVLGLGMAPGRASVDVPDLLRHDVAAFALTWATLIALSCVVIGVLAASLARLSGTSLRVSYLVAAGASLLPLSWFVTGYPIEYGFYNTHLSILVMMAAMLVFLGADRRPAVAFASQAVASTLMLALWSPLVLMPGLLAVVILFRHARTLLTARGATGAVMVLAVVQLIAYGLAVALPGLLALSGFLLAPGGVFGFPRPMLFGFAGLTMLVATLLFWRRSRLAIAGIAALAAASVVGLGVLLFVTRNQENPWTYYPLKFSWLATLMLLVLLCGLLPAFAAKLTRGSPGPLRALALAVSAAGIIGFLLIAPTFGQGYIAKNPALRLLSGDVLGDGDEVAEQIFDLADPQQPALLWRTDDPFEGSINFWILQMWSNSMSENLELKYAAYGLYDPDDPSEMCRIVDLMGGGVVVYTADADLLSQGAGQTCPGRGITLVDVTGAAVERS